jgi:hypothetical protein
MLASRQALVEIAAARGVVLAPEWSTVDDLVPLLDTLMAEDAVIVVRMDGQRAADRYDTIITGGRLGSHHVNTQCATLLDAIATAVVRYERFDRGLH